MADIFGAISNIRLIFIAAAIIAVIAIVWKFSSDLKGWNPLGGLFGAAQGETGESAKEEIRDEIDETEQAIKTQQVELKEQTFSQIDKNRDIILDKEQDTAEQVKRVVEKETAETEARLLDELEAIETRILARLQDAEAEDDKAARFARLKDIWRRYSDAGSCMNEEECAKRNIQIEGWEYEEMTDAFQAGEILISSNGVLLNNL